VHPVVVLLHPVVGFVTLDGLFVFVSVCFVVWQEEYFTGHIVVGTA